MVGYKARRGHSLMLFPLHVVRLGDMAPLEGPFSAIWMPVVAILMVALVIRIVIALLRER